MTLLLGLSIQIISAVAFSLFWSHLAGLYVHGLNGGFRPAKATPYFLIGSIVLQVAALIILPGYWRLIALPIQFVGFLAAGMMANRRAARRAINSDQIAHAQGIGD